MEYLSMCDIKEGNWGEIVELKCAKDIRRRFMDLGMIKGTKVKCVLVSPFNSIKGYAIRGSVIAIRHSDAKNIIVRGCNFND